MGCVYLPAMQSKLPDTFIGLNDAGWGADFAAADRPGYLFRSGPLEAARVTDSRRRPPPIGEQSAPRAFMRCSAIDCTELDGERLRCAGQRLRLAGIRCLPELASC